MKINELKKLVKSAVKEAIQEELKEILLEAAKAHTNFLLNKRNTILSI